MVDQLSVVSHSVPVSVVLDCHPIVAASDVVWSHLQNQPFRENHGSRSGNGLGRGLFLVHAMAHGVEHRRQIGVVQAQVGLEVPNLDSWASAERTRLGEGV